MKKFLIPIISLLLGFGVTAQNADDRITDYSASSADWQEVSLFESASSRKNLTLPAELENYEVLEIQTSSLLNLNSMRSSGITMELPYKQGTIELELVRVYPFAQGFNVIEMPSGIEVEVNLGIHYRGRVKGEEGSIAALSVFENEVMGLFSSRHSQGNMVLGKLESSLEYILYEDMDINEAFSMICETEDTVEDSPRPLDTSERSATRCPSVYFDISNDIYVNKGGTTQAVNYISALFNQVALVYDIHDIGIVISGSTVWTDEEPFSSLGSYNTYKGNNPWTGDLAHYVLLNYGGGVAYVGALCGGTGLSGINSSYNTVPTYSWSVNVLAHELGHNLGSQHTHACAWNGDDTAIDGCGPNANPDYSEGCSGTNPPGGGTVMSYCHLTSVGVDLSLGFGPQPAARITNYIDSRSCTDACGPPPTCDDGILNGSEEGIDCGGPDCTPCPTCQDGIQNGDETDIDCGGSVCATCPGSCPESELVLTILTDQYPVETTWQLLDDAQQVVHSGGPYSSSDTEYTNILCVPDGCYTFTISDSYGDGICCQYGIGSYELKDYLEDILLASGGNFASSESSSFCVSSQNECTAFSAPMDLAKSFQAVDGVQDRVQLKWYKDSPTIKYTDSDAAACDIKAWPKRNLDPISGAGIGNPIQNPDTISLIDKKKTYPDGSPRSIFKWPMFFRSNGANNSNRVDPNVRYQWKVRCACDHGAGPESPWSVVKLFNTPDFDPSSGIYTPPAGFEWTDDGLKMLNSYLNKIDLYPNPAHSILNLSFYSYKGQKNHVEVYDLYGRLLMRESVISGSDNQLLSLDIQGLPEGSYLVTVINDVNTHAERFVVSR